MPCALAAAFVWPGLAAAAPGDLDPSFSKDGKAVVDAAGCQAGQAAAVQPDGKIVVAATVYPELPDGECGWAGSSGAVRLLPSGKLDTSFGDDGIATIAEGSATAVALQPDGRILVGGGKEGTSGGAIAQLMPDGTLDPTFGQGGVITGPHPVRAITIAADGGILVGTTVGDRNFCLRSCLAVAKLTPEGASDAAFAGGMGVALAYDYRGDTTLSEVAVLPSGEIAAGGAFVPRCCTHRSSTLVFARFDGTGNRDPGFDADGIATANLIPPTAENTYWYSSSRAAIAVAPGGNLVGVGATDQGLGAARVSPEGETDPSYGVGGLAAFGRFTPKEQHAYATDAIVSGDGSLLAGGVTARLYDDDRDTYVVAEDFALARLTPAGQLDTAFGARTGRRAIDFFTSDDIATELELGADGRILQVGTAYDGFSERHIALAQYTSAPGPPDLDADGIRDRRDGCPEAYAKAHGGCPRLGRRLTLRYDGGQTSRFSGTLTSRYERCDDGTVMIFRARRGRDKFVLRAHVDYRGDFGTDYGAPRGRFYARIEPRDLTIRGVCEGKRSRALSLP